MDIKYNDSARADELAERAEAFMEDEVIPAERDELLGGGQVSDKTITRLQEEAKNRDIFAPQIPEEFGGMGESFRDVLPVFEQAGKSLLGPPAMRVDAPNEGNTHTIDVAGSEEQKERWGIPIAEGEMESAISMTEPLQGGGSDPKMLKTTAELDGDEWVINGHKWWTSNAKKTDVLLVLARTDQDAHPYEGCSLFIVPIDTPGVTVERHIPHLGGENPIGVSHSEVTYNDVRVPKENLLGELNAGFQIAQKRLGPARLTHCMRYSGMAERSLRIAKEYMDERQAFGDKLSEKQKLRFDVADAEARLHSIRAMARHAADQIAAGNEARTAVAMCKYLAANEINDIIDTSLQLCGGNGVAKDLPIAYFLENARPFRIFDGPDEVHLRSIARASFDELEHPEEIAHITRF